MSLESFRELCNRGKHYHFLTSEDFDKRVAYDGQDVSEVKFERGLECNPSGLPTKRYAYGIIPKNFKIQYKNKSDFYFFFITDERTRNPPQYPHS